MEPQATNSPDSHVVQSAAAVRQAYSATPIDQPTSGLPADNNGVTPVSTVQPADESAIEQQWIEKAKEIVLRTQNDPFMQNKLLSQLKAEYLSTRYGRSTGIKQDK